MAKPNGQSSLVRNAADPRQLKFAAQVERRRAERLAIAMKAMLNEPHGRIVLAALIRRAGVYKSIWHPSAEIHYLAGRQDYGHELMADLVAVDEAAYQLMEREEWEWQKQEERAIEAAHVNRAARPEGDRDGERQS